MGRNNVMSLDQMQARREAAQRESNERAMGVRLTLGGWAAQLLAGHPDANQRRVREAAATALALWHAINDEADARAHEAQAKSEDAKPTPPVPSPSVISAP